MTRLAIFMGCLLLARATFAQEEPRRPIDGIMDNSFLIEEAYNQEQGVVQHIFNALYGVRRITESKDRALDLTFTQEWPLYGQAHQFSYTIPYGFSWNGGKSARGLADVLLNYRYQAYLNEKSLTAFAPRFSLVLPTGNDRNGFGNGTLGYQWNLPFSTTLSDRWFVHANAGLTFLPDVGGADRLNFNLGASAIYCVNGRLNLMVEWLGNWNETSSDSGGFERHFSSVLSPGVRFAFNLRSGSQIVLGLGLPIGLTRTAPDLGVFLYLSFEHSLFGRKR